MNHKGKIEEEHQKSSKLQINFTNTISIYDFVCMPKFIPNYNQIKEL